MLLGFTIMTVYVPGIVGLASNTSWAVMWLAMPILLLNCKIEVTAVHILGLLFLSYSAITLLWSPHGMLELMQLLALASVFVWGYTLKDLRSVTIGLSIGLAISSTIAVLQYFQVELSVITVGKMTGLFVNPNIYAEASGMILILILINKLWWFIPATVPGLLVSSRAVILGLGLALAFKLWAKSKLLSIATVIGSIAIVHFKTFSFSVVKDAGQIASSAKATESIAIRLDAWIDMIAGFTIFGNGLGSFVYLFPEHNKHLDTTVSLAEYAHNDLLQLIFELGIGAIPLILIVALLLKVRNEHSPALIFFLVIGFFGFPLHMPVTAFMFALVAAQLAKFSLGSRFTFNNSRSVLFNRLEAA